MPGNFETRLPQWGFSTKRLRERLRENGRVLSTQNGTQNTDGAPCRQTTMRMVKLEAWRASRHRDDADDADDTSSRGRSPPQRRSTSWLDDVSEDEDDIIMTSALLPLVRPAAVRPAASPALPHALEQATQTQRTVSLGMMPAEHLGAAAVTRGLNYLEMTEEIPPLCLSCSALAPACLDSSTVHRHGGEAVAPHRDVGCSPRQSVLCDRQTQTRWRAEVQREEGRDKRDKSIGEMRDRETSLQIDLQKQKDLVETLRRSEQRACRVRDEALHKYKDAAEQLQQAHKHLQETRSHNTSFAAPSDPSLFEDLSTNNATQSAAKDAVPGQSQHLVRAQGKSWRVLEAERGRRQAEEREVKHTKELDEERQRCRLLTSTLQVVFYM